MLKDCKFHHIGYAVKNIEKTANYYVGAGWEKSSIYTDLTQKTYVAFLMRDGFPLIELVSPIDENSPISRMLNSNGNTPYHVCYSVPDIYVAIAELRTQRYLPLFNPVEAIGLGNKKICYLMHPEVGLIEIVER